MNPRPLSTRKKVQLMVALTLLAWATQTLLAQWGYGQDVRADEQELVEERANDQVEHIDLDLPPAPAENSVDQADEDDPAKDEPAEDADAPAGGEGRAGAAEKFIPGTARFEAGATLGLRSEARVFGAEVRLKQVCRWTEADQSVFEPLAELVLTRLDDKTPFESISLPQIRRLLSDAGANLGAIRFAGPLTCTVSRTDVAVDERQALQKWADATEAAGIEIAAGSTAADAEVAPPTAPRDADDRSSVRTLRAVLVADLSSRLGIPKDQIEMRFNPRDEKMLKLAEPLFQFHLKPRHVSNLGSVSWDVTISTGEEEPQTVLIAGNARAWQQQVVLNRPLAYRQVVGKEDIMERRALVDRVPEDALLELSQVVGRQAARDINGGAVLTASLVEEVALVEPGQVVMITLEQEGVKVQTVARALEGGSFGQSVRVKNEATRDIYEVTLTGPQEGTLGPAIAATDEQQPNIASVPQD